MERTLPVSERRAVAESAGGLVLEQRMAVQRPRAQRLEHAVALLDRGGAERVDPAGDTHGPQRDGEDDQAADECKAIGDGQSRPQCRHVTPSARTPRRGPS